MTEDTVVVQEVSVGMLKKLTLCMDVNIGTMVYYAQGTDNQEHKKVYFDFMKRKAAMVTQILDAMRKETKTDNPVTRWKDDVVCQSSGVVETFLALGQLADEIVGKAGPIAVTPDHPYFGKFYDEFPRQDIGLIV